MKNWLNNKIVIILLHVAGWLLFMSVPYLMRPDHFQDRLQDQLLFRFIYFDKWNLVNYAFLAAVFYANIYLLIPRLLNRSRIGWYMLCLIGILGISFLIANSKPYIVVTRMLPPAEAIHRRPPPQDFPRLRINHRPPVVPALTTVFFILTFSSAYRFFLDKISLTQRQQILQTEHLKSELGFLRSQISPHFIFNTLNSAVALTRTNMDQVEPTLIKLSGLMRYMLYDAVHAQVPLNQEVEYLDSYIDLQQLRFGDKVKISFEKSGSLFGYGIEPMLLIPFVENAFKHGLHNIQNPAIEIILKEHGGTLHFSVKNRYSIKVGHLKVEHSGIGLSNVRKRLALLYEFKHKLQILQTAEWYEVHLNLQLK